MSYEKAFEALNAGDYGRAVELLEGPAAENAYQSDIVNHAFTLALYRAEAHEKLADVAFRVGSTLVATDPASAMDYFQRSIHSGLDAPRVRCIGEVFEDWACESVRPKLVKRIEKIGHVVGSLTQDHPARSYLRLLTDALRSRGLESTIFTTEATSSWFIHPTQHPQSQAEAQSGFSAPIHIASVEGDFVQRAERIANAIRESGVQLVLYHGNLSDQIMARVASLRPAPIQVNVDHDVEMDTSLFDGFIHVRRNSLERTRYKQHAAEWISLSSDIDQKIQQCTFESRDTLGIESAATISASFRGPNRDQLGFVSALIEILNRSPRHYHLFVGPADVRTFRGLLHSEGVLPRVRFLGHLGDVVPLLGVIDLQLVPFPATESTTVLEMMGTGRPVVAMRYSSESEFNTAAELVGEMELTPRTSAAYTQTVDRLLRDPDARSRLGDALYARFDREFHRDRFAERYFNFIKLLESRHLD